MARLIHFSVLLLVFLPRRSLTNPVAKCPEPGINEVKTLLEETKESFPREDFDNVLKTAKNVEDFIKDMSKGINKMLRDQEKFDGKNYPWCLYKPLCDFSVKVIENWGVAGVKTDDGSDLKCWIVEPVLWYMCDKGCPDDEECPDDKTDGLACRQAFTKKLVYVYCDDNSLKLRPVYTAYKCSLMIYECVER